MKEGRKERMNKESIALLFSIPTVLYELELALNFGTTCLCGGQGGRGRAQDPHTVFLLPRWLFEGLGRDKAEELLLLPDTKMGSFMIRESETKKGEASLTPLATRGLTGARFVPG